MKKISIIVGGLVVVALALIITKPEKEVTETTYNELSSTFTKVTVDDIVKKQNNNEFFLLYTGRGTCPDCRAFIPKFHKVYKKLDFEVFYLNSENTKTDEQLKNFRDTYDMPTVPNLTVFRGTEVVASLKTAENNTQKELHDFVLENYINNLAK